MTLYTFQLLTIRDEWQHSRLSKVIMWNLKRFLMSKPLISQPSFKQEDVLTSQRPTPLPPRKRAHCDGNGEKLHFRDLNYRQSKGLLAEVKTQLRSRKSVDLLLHGYVYPLPKIANESIKVFTLKQACRK